MRSATFPDSRSDHVFAVWDGQELRLGANYDGFMGVDGGDPMPLSVFFGKLGIVKKDCDEAFGVPFTPSRDDFSLALRGVKGLQVSGPLVLNHDAQRRFSGAICALKFAAGELTEQEFKEELLRWA